MHGFGRLLISLGLLMAAIGAAILAAEKFGLPIGRLPGDFSFRGKHSSFYFPLTTCLLLSALLSLLIYLLGRMRR